jgi:parallel beta-helix repeat protein
VQACIIRNVGDFEGNGVQISGGSSNGVIGNDLYEIGSDAIVLMGGTRTTLAPAGNYAENNEVHHFGVFNKAAAGIHVLGVGNRVSRNTVHDGPRFGIWCSGNNQIVELNRVHHVNLETDDTGIIYCNGMDWLSPRGSIIRYNYLSDSQGFGFQSGQRVQPWHAVGIYLDDDGAGVDIVGNIVANCSQAALKLHNARDNLIVNNIFLNCNQQQIGYWGWTSSSGNWTSLLPGMVAAYQSVAGQAAWQKLRGVNVHPTNAVLSGGLIMANNQFFRNIIAYTNVGANLAYFRNVSWLNNRWDSNVVYHFDQPVTTVTDSQSARDWNSWRAQGMDVNSVAADPLFVNAGAGDFRLRPESPALRLGFEQIPIDRIGIYPSPLRATSARPPTAQGLRLVLTR